MANSIWRAEAPAPPEELSALRAAAPRLLPVSYFEQLESSNGGEGSLSIQPCWVAFWPARDVIEHNRDYGVREHLPGFFGFGSNGGGELLAFDLRASGPPPVVMIPFVGMDPTEAVVVATTFEAFRSAIGT